MEQRRFPRWPVAVLVSLGLVGAFVAVAGAIEGSNDRGIFDTAKQDCGARGVASVTTVGNGQSFVCRN
jgi:hypothetical protein